MAAPLSEIFSLGLTADRTVLKEVVSAVVHSILFHRVFGAINPREVDVLTRITYPAIDDDSVTLKVEEKVQAFVRSVDAGQPSTTGQRLESVALPSAVTTGACTCPLPKIAVTFYERRPKKVWFGKSEDNVWWERWIVTVTVVAPRTERERLKVRSDLETELAEGLKMISCITQEKRDHIPPITSNNLNPFPYQISVPSSSEGWGMMLKKMLTDASPLV